MLHLGKSTRRILLIKWLVYCPDSDSQYLTQLLSPGRAPYVQNAVLYKSPYLFNSICLPITALSASSFTQLFHSHHIVYQCRVLFPPDCSQAVFVQAYLRQVFLQFVTMILRCLSFLTSSPLLPQSSSSYLNSPFAFGDVVKLQSNLTDVLPLQMLLCIRTIVGSV